MKKRSTEMTIYNLQQNIKFGKRGRKVYKNTRIFSGK